MVFGSRIMLRPCIERSEVLIHTMSYTGAAGIDNSRLRSMKVIRSDYMIQIK